MSWRYCNGDEIETVKKGPIKYLNRYQNKNLLAYRLPTFVIAMLHVEVFHSGAS
jgi:hypothetical protein